MHVHILPMKNLFLRHFHQQFRVKSGVAILKSKDTAEVKKIVVNSPRVIFSFIKNQNARKKPHRREQRFVYRSIFLWLTVL